MTTCEGSSPCDPATTLTAEDMCTFTADVRTISTVVESSELTTTTKSGKEIDTLAGRLNKLGYIPPIAYAGGISFAAQDNTKTVERNNIVYAPLPSQLPFTTSGTWVGDDDGKFYVVQDEIYYRVDTIADARALPAGAPTWVTVRGYYAANDNIVERIYFWDAGSTAADDGGAVLLPDGHSGPGRRILIHGVITNATWWGVKMNDSGFDSSTQLKNYWDYTASRGGGRAGVNYYDPGDIYCAEVEAPNLWKNEGAGSSATRFIYNGPGGAGTSVFRITVGGPFDRLTRLQVLGTMDQNTTAQWAENCIRVTSGATVDNQAEWGDFNVGICAGDAIFLEDGANVANWHFNQVRCDGVGGYFINFATKPDYNSRAFSLRNFTLDNLIRTGSPTPQPGHWGLGVLRVRAGGNVTTAVQATIETGRVEVNSPLITQTYGSYTAGETPSLFYFQHQSGSGYTSEVNVTDVYAGGTGFSADQALIHCTADMPITIRNCRTDSNTFCYKDGVSSGVSMSVKGNQAWYTALPALAVGNSTSLVRVRRFADQPITPGGYTKIEFDQTSYNNNGEWDATLFRYVVKRPGRYEIKLKFRIGSLSASQIALGAVFVDGVEWESSATLGGGAQTFVSVTAVAYLAVDQYIEGFADHTDSGPLNISGSNTANTLSVTYHGST